MVIPNRFVLGSVLLNLYACIIIMDQILAIINCYLFMNKLIYLLTKIYTAYNSYYCNIVEMYNNLPIKVFPQTLLIITFKFKIIYRIDTWNCLSLSFLLSVSRIHDAIFQNIKILIWYVPICLKCKYI